MDLLGNHSQKGGNPTRTHQASSGGINSRHASPLLLGWLYAPRKDGKSLIGEPTMDAIQRAFTNVKRADYLTDDTKALSGRDAPLSIGYGQTNSQPTTVRMMLEWLDPQPGEKILDVGSGSGWTTALLAYLVGPKGRVHAVEKVPELVTFGRNNCQRAGFENVHFSQAGKSYGLPRQAPFDRILVSAAAASLPQELINQLKNGGRLVIPVRESVLVVDKISDTDFTTDEHYGFAFVPLMP